MKTATLQVDPEEVTFSKPEGESEQQSMTVELRNVGNGPLIIASIQLTEDDDIQELSLLDADDWNSPVTLQPEDSRQVTIAWQMRDARADQGRLIVEHNAGPQRVIPISTPDIDPRISVLTEPMGDVDVGKTTLNLNQATQGRTQRVRVEISSLSLAPLDVRNICLLNRDGRCGEDNTDETGAYRICAVAGDEGAECNALAEDIVLRQGETYVFDVHYSPIDSQNGVLVGQVLLESNAALSPQYQIELRGSVCTRDLEGSVCDGCGNGEVDEGEACDDGNINDDDECRNDCTSAVCGDGMVIDGVEACDDGNDDDTDECLSTCERASCGDGHVQVDVEACDDGNEDDTDDCLSDCRVARCGDGFVQAGVEECDDGNDSDMDGCLSNCRLAGCGDGVVMDFFEECDDANQDNTDACLNDCRLARCGDGFVRPDEEECDDGNAVTESCEYGVQECIVCDAECRETPGQAAFCGDGERQDPEECDDENDEIESCEYGVEACVVCGPECTQVAGMTQTCGDGIVNGPELCDGDDGCADDCLSRGPERGDGQYGDPCECGNDCASGLCVTHPRLGRGQCTQECVNEGVCPGIDRCVQTPYPAPQGQCPDPGLDFEVGEMVDICVPNETGVPCFNPADCPFDGICVSPPNPLVGQIPVPSQCAARCERDNQCPTGYRCEEVLDQDGQPLRICNANVDITRCAGGNQNLCGGICRTRPGEDEASVVACVTPTNARDGFCSCLCATADDCPRGFGCSPQYASGNPFRPFACIPMAGYICPGGNQNLCLGESCLFDPDIGLNQCTSACRNEGDCPQGFRCIAIPGSAFNYCSP